MLVEEVATPGDMEVDEVAEVAEVGVADLKPREDPPLADIFFDLSNPEKSLEKSLMLISLLRGDRGLATRPLHDSHSRI